MGAAVHGLYGHHGNSSDDLPADSALAARPSQMGPLNTSAHW